MELLRFLTAGNVDDGKSTLIGRLLFDSKNIHSDHLEAITAASKGKENPDLALLTDGLRAEREQGITIDVAYRYFNTDKRKFIIADAPGHVQYTRNMVTAASNADLIIILIDVRTGVTEQTRRHSLIASLLKIKNVVVAVNKLDLTGYDEKRFNEITSEYQKLAEGLSFKTVQYIPVSAIEGENIVERSLKINWYQGPSLLEILENAPAADELLNAGRFFVQLVIRPQSSELHDYRGYAGQVNSGTFRKGDEVVVLPSGKKSTISRIESHSVEIDEASAGKSVIIQLSDDIDISRGDLLVPVSDIQPTVSQSQEALICWLDDKNLKPGGRYILQQQSNTVTALISEITHVIDVNTGSQEPAGAVNLNQVAKIKLKTARPLAFDDYQSSRSTGGFILIDETSNLTAGGGLFLS